MFASVKTSIDKFTYTEFVAVIFILLFVYTASSKLMELESFTAVLRTSPLIRPYANYFSIGIISIELLVAALLFSLRTREGGLVLSLILMLLFTIYIAYLLLSNSHLPCTCGGVVEKFTWKEHLVFNLLLTIIAATGVFQHKIFIAMNRGNRKPEIE